MSFDLGRIGIWTGALDAHPTARAQDAARHLEQLGYSTLWIPEAVGREPFVSAANLLAATSSLKLATGIANIYARDPMTMAAGQKTLAEAFPGRFLLGLGVSHGHLVAGVRKHDYSKPYSHMVEYLDRMDKALFMARGPEDDGGRLLAALGPKMLELARDRSAGAHPYLVTPEHTALARETMGPDALLAVEQGVVLDTDPDAARAVARNALSIYATLPNYTNNWKRLGFTDEDVETLSDRLVDALVAWGDVDAVGARVQAHRDAGADHVCVQLLAAPGEPVDRDAWRRLAAALIE